MATLKESTAHLIVTVMTANIIKFLNTDEELKHTVDHTRMLRSIGLSGEESLKTFCECQAMALRKAADQVDESGLRLMKILFGKSDLNEKLIDHLSKHGPEFP